MATEKRPRVYFDSCVFLALFLGEVERVEKAEAALESATQGITQGCISPLVVSEVIGAPSLRAPQGRLSEADAPRLDHARDYFLATKFQYVDIAQVAAHRAMEHAVRFQLKGPDALHLALAQLGRCDELHTYDGKLLKVENQLSGLRVRTPHGQPQSSLNV